MKSTRWWMRQLSTKVWKKRQYKHKGRVLLSACGTSYTLKQWEETLNEVKNLKPGDLVWNIFTKERSIVKEIVFLWRNDFRIKWRSVDDFVEYNLPGQYIGEFQIHTTDGYILRDSPTVSEYWANKGE